MEPGKVIDSTSNKVNIEVSHVNERDIFIRLQSFVHFVVTWQMTQSNLAHDGTDGKIPGPSVHVGSPPLHQLLISTCEGYIADRASCPLLDIAV